MMFLEPSAYITCHDAQNTISACIKCQDVQHTTCTKIHAHLKDVPLWLNLYMWERWRNHHAHWVKVSPTRRGCYLDTLLTFSVCVCVSVCVVSCLCVRAMCVCVGRRGCRIIIQWAANLYARHIHMQMTQTHTQTRTHALVQGLKH